MLNGTPGCEGIPPAPHVSVSVKFVALDGTFANASVNPLSPPPDVLASVIVSDSVVPSACAANISGAGVSIIGSWQAF
jgi:hypothetical protein